MTTRTQLEEARLLPALALALVDAPRANLQELARLVGISKASLHRFCRTREELVSRIAAQSILLMEELTREITDIDPLQGLHCIALKALDNRELVAFTVGYWDRVGICTEAHARWYAQLDALFLRGQQAGVFRIDVPAPALSELWVAVVRTLVDAERRGRVARAGLFNLLHTTFLEGAQAPQRSQASPT